MVSAGRPFSARWGGAFSCELEPLLLSMPPPCNRSNHRLLIANFFCAS
jgi:hypothetical protein